MVITFFPLNGMLLRWLCERAFRSRVNTAESGSGRAVAEIPNELNAGAILPATRDSVNANYYQIKNTQNGGTFLYLFVSCSANRSFELQKRSQLFVGAHNETFSVVPMCVCNPDWSLIAIHSKPDRPKRQGRFTGLSAFSKISAKRANFFRELVESYTGGFGRVPQRNVRIGNFANAL
jgi:hypothetical protein